jgi:hypothetical protein
MRYAVSLFVMVSQPALSYANSHRFHQIVSSQAQDRSHYPPLSTTIGILPYACAATLDGVNRQACIRALAPVRLLEIARFHPVQQKGPLRSMTLGDGGIGVDLQARGAFRPLEIVQIYYSFKYALFGP